VYNITQVAIPHEFRDGSLQIKVDSLTKSTRCPAVQKRIPEAGSEAEVHPVNVVAANIHI